jgi:hypothetical protein
MIIGLKLPVFLAILIILASPPQSNQQPATNILGKPKINSTKHNNKNESQYIRNECADE